MSDDTQPKVLSVRFALVDPQRIKHRIVRNPNYSGRSLSLNSWKEYRLREVRKPDLQKTLNADIQAHGFRNPIVIYAIDEGLYLLFGGSRLRAAHDLGLPAIPCIVNDYTGEFSDQPEVTPENWESFFEDIPCWHEFGEDGFDCHYGLERMRRDEWGDATTGFNWLRWKEYDRSFIQREMPWALDLIPDDTPPHSTR